MFNTFWTRLRTIPSSATSHAIPSPTPFTESPSLSSSRDLKQHVKYLQIVVCALQSLKSADRPNDLYLILQSGIESICSPLHCRIVVRDVENDVDRPMMTVNVGANHTQISAEIESRPSRRADHVVLIEAEMGNERWDEVANGCVKALVEACKEDIVQLRRRQQIEVDVRKANGLLDLRRQCNQSQTRATRPDIALERFLQITQQLMKAERMLALMVDVHDNVLAPLVLDEDAGGLTLSPTYQVDAGLLGTIISGKKSVAVNNVQTHRLYKPTADPFTDTSMRHIVAQPIFDRSLQVVAIVVAINRVDDDEPFDPVCNGHEAGFSEHEADLLDQCCLEMSDFLLTHFTESMTRRATRLNISAFSLMEAYLGRSESEPASSTCEASILSHRASRSLEMFDGGLTPLQSPRSSPEKVVIVPPAPPAPLRSPRIEISALQQLDTVDIDVFACDDAELDALCLVMMRNLDVVERIGESCLANLIPTIRSQYHDHPFHNFRHAFSVMHTTYLFILRHDDVRSTLGLDRIFGVMIASLGHDIDHPGHTNQFEINTDSELANRYNGKSVLENYHASCLMKVLKESSIDPFAHLDPPSKRALKDLIVDAILGTDMSKHIGFNRRLNSMDDRIGLLLPESFVDQNMLVKTIVHASDLSAQGYNTSIAVKWEERISAEFRQQAETETALGLPVASFMMDLDNEQHRAQLQISFIDFVLRPFWKEIARLFPGVAHLYHNIILRTRRYFTTLKCDGKAAALDYLQSQITTTMASHSSRCHTFPISAGNRGSIADGQGGAGAGAQVNPPDNPLPESHRGSIELLRGRTGPAIAAGRKTSSDSDIRRFSPKP